MIPKGINANIKEPVFEWGVCMPIGLLRECRSCALHHQYVAALPMMAEVLCLSPPPISIGQLALGFSFTSRCFLIMTGYYQGGRKNRLRK